MAKQDHAPNHNPETFKKKRIKKGPTTFQLQLNEEQKEAKAEILNNTLTALSGKAGSGKTLLACQIALDGLILGRYDKILITRPTVSKEDIGFLPGDMKEKLDPWVQPIYQNMFMLRKKDEIEKLVELGKIEIVPISFMRGRTFVDSVVIVDEAQNVTHSQMEMIVTRIGLGSIMIVCGDDRQVDLNSNQHSGFRFLYSLAKKIKNMTSITLKENHRNPIVDDLIESYEDLAEKTSKK